MGLDYILNNWGKVYEETVMSPTKEEFENAKALFKKLGYVETKDDVAENELTKRR